MVEIILEIAVSCNNRLSSSLANSHCNDDTPELRASSNAASMITALMAPLSAPAAQSKRAPPAGVKGMALTSFG